MAKEKQELSPKAKVARLLVNTMGHPILIATGLVDKMNEEEVAQMANLYDENAIGSRVHAVYGQHQDRLRKEQQEASKAAAAKKDDPISVSEIADQKAVVDDALPSASGGEVPAVL